MRKLIVTAAALLALATPAVSLADGTTSAQKADRVARLVAQGRYGYWERLRVDHLRGRDSFVYYLVWRTPTSVCKYEREPHVVVYRRSGVVRPYDFDAWNVRCTRLW